MQLLRQQSASKSLFPAQNVGKRYKKKKKNSNRLSLFCGEKKTTDNGMCTLPSLVMPNRVVSIRQYSRVLADGWKETTDGLTRSGVLVLPSVSRRNFECLVKLLHLSLPESDTSSREIP